MIELISQVIIVVTLIFFAFYCYYDWKLGVPTVSTSMAGRQKIASLIPASAHEVVEMGSGWGGLAIAVARARPDCRVVGVEFSLLPYLVSRLRLMLSPELKNLTFVRKDFFTLDFSKTDAVLCYLLVPILARLRPKFLAELPDHAVIISNTYEMPEWTPARTEHFENVFEKGIRIYQKSGAL